MRVVIHRSETVVLFIRQWFHQLVKDPLLEGPDALRGVLEDLSQLRVITSSPLRFPGHFYGFILCNEISMHILEVEDICSVFSDILDMALDVVDVLAPARVTSAELGAIDHLEVWLNL